MFPGKGSSGRSGGMRESADLGLPTIPTEAGDLPRGSQEEGRRHGGRRPIKVYALHSCQRRIGLEFGERGVHR